MKEREKFDKWDEEQAKHNATDSDRLWNAWQAALSAAPTPPEERKETLAYDPEDWTIDAMRSAEKIMPCLVGYGLNMETCTLRFQEVEYGYDLHYKSGEAVTTAPNDELRAAAEKAQLVMELIYDATGDWAHDLVYGPMCNLRSALGKKMSNVVHCKKARYDVLIDRRTKWGNPFPMRNPEDRDRVIKAYREWIVTQPALMNSLHELKGKTLGCWCAPLPCHGDVLAELADKLETKA